jgi:hypothetical protein
MERLRDEGIVKWGCLAGCVVALEFIGDESLTHATYRALGTKVGKLAVPAALALTAGHLLHVIPERYDPYFALAKTIDWIKN